MEKFEFTPIGVVHSSCRYRAESPRQGVFSSSEGEIELFPAFAGDAVADLAGFSRIWVIFCFHLNHGHSWKPRVRPPFPASGVCRSLFATRSPYRVNPIGLSCVELTGVSDRRLFLRGIDMLDGTPVLDIKPYIPAADAFPDASAGWRDDGGEPLPRPLSFSPLFLAQAEFLRRRGAPDLVNFAEVQLAAEPCDASRKRVKPLDGERWILACRTWRMIFTVDAASGAVRLSEVLSGYRPEELAPGAEDPYRDKDLHREYETWNRRAASAAPEGKSFNNEENA